MGLMVFLQSVLNLRWTTTWPKRDISSAFLQGQASQGKDNVFVEPCAELREAMGVDRNYVIRFLKAVYGLCNAPRVWNKKV